MADDTLVTVDLAKTVFQVAFSSHPGQVSKNRRLSGTQFAEFLAQLPEATIVMEACGSAHFWARRMQALRHTPVHPPRAHREALRRPQQDRPRRHLEMVRENCTEMVTENRTTRGRRSETRG